MLKLNYLWVPENGDRGGSFCEKVSEDLVILDAHNHDGVNSEKISPKNLNKETITLATAEWLADGDKYKQTMTLPSGYAFETAAFKCFFASGALSGREFHPTINRVTSTTVDLVLNTNAYDVKVVLL